MIFDRTGIWATMFPKRSVGRPVIVRWQAAAARSPDLAQDLIRLGGVLTLQPWEAGQAAPLDPLRLAYEAGRRDFAVQLLSMMELDPLTLTHLLENNE